MTTLPMFPLGAVLFPHMPLHLRVFEQRYLVMMARVLDAETAVFGVVLIERGQEVGGGEHRFGIGTVARITQIEAPEGFVGVVAHGERRIEVLEWLDDDPYPQASVRELPELEWDDELFPLRERAERVVRRALALASEFTEQPWAPDVELSGDPAVAAWQLAAIAPVGPLDQIELLRSESMEALLTRLVEVTEAVADSFGA
ncbi:MULTISPECIES: LON peptidase substrate-binding domain-containing protein [unclassified Cryobacterium]|uniref:LON peptidase substrate-binding domain-containing protein n=1 Tax=unclassified Cryobacterium TaxID=2649013 RepID=UPI002AB56830|nr:MULTISPECIES: LON peptidase substrate-binding domain-containing protein [unclassified Cryobacterium]MDY7527041.1 LON peptidase substrate-binding domain-containing protein [Cryobacterium sp. 10C2]MEB0203452.1 LON peptidase substrate-binding domain-containing protein [Cryobacterium sp. 5I3]MEB0287047.1 LON peptidase substrate-binding domain-containing protein [Cryobacterium sp. 10S3]MEB0290173.1 LON peptidase substrate-binding domain-containing protein [Cryobacterium sp. 10C2]WPX14508.1 LON p